MLQYLKTPALFLLLACFSLAAEASLITWDFTWERSNRSNLYSGVGMFSYDSSAGARVTHGGSWFGDLDDELTAFSFEGFVNGVSLGATNALPQLFGFSADRALIFSLSSNKFRLSQGAGVGCLLNYCSLFEDGSRVRGSTGSLSLTQRDAGAPTGLPEPGLFGLTMAGMLLGIWLRRRSDVAA